MKKRNWISLMLIIVCLGVLLCYQAVDRMRTDNKAPKITIGEALLEVSVLDPREALLEGVTAVDDVDGNVTASLVVESVRLLRNDGTVNVTYAAFDKAGNVAKQTREVRYRDYESPRFYLSEPLLFGQRNYDLLSIITAQDILDGDITHRIRATALDEVVSDYNGIYNVQFQVTNSLGETVELVLPVEVYTPGTFEARMTLTDYLIYLEPGDYFNARNYLDSFTVGRETLSLEGSVPDTLKLSVSGSVETGTPGIYVIDYQISYCPNPELTGQVYTAYSKLIVVVEG